ncbi:MAG: hypothetical protein HY329_14480 [Chloroflexi bacterium]|nr:hypothetical protein [Chloroflexota bacterium]
MAARCSPVCRSNPSAAADHAVDVIAAACAVVSERNHGIRRVIVVGLPKEARLRAAAYAWVVDLALATEATSQRAVVEIKPWEPWFEELPRKKWLSRDWLVPCVRIWHLSR